jgi:hypothetical protein
MSGIGSEPGATDTPPPALSMSADVFHFYAREHGDRRCAYTGCVCHSMQVIEH